MLLRSVSHCTHYDLVGPEDAPVVCLTHALLADMGMWADQVGPLIEAGFRVLRIDMRGHGGSVVFSENCSLDDLAQDVITVLDHLGLAKVHYVGLSIGGVIGQAIATRHPERLSSLVLSDTNATAAPNAAAMWTERVGVVRNANSAAPLADGMMGRLLTAAFKERRPIRWAEIRATIEGTSPQGVYVGAQALQGFDFAQGLPELRMPTLVVCGQDDPATPPSEAKKIAGLIPNARYAEIRNALHFPNVEQDKTYSELLVSWCREAQR